MTNFSTYVHAMGRGPSKGRNLTQAEAADAMSQILDGSADPHAVGALLMLMRYRGETPDEIAGFVQALRDRSKVWQNLGAYVDWPSYAAGRTRGLPWFLLAAKLVAQAGFPVLLHGWNSHQKETASVRGGVEALGIASCTDPASAGAGLAQQKIVYCPLEGLDGDALRVLQLRSVLGLRSAINTALRGFNPTLAPISVQGVFHPSYRELQVNAARILGQDRMIVIKGGGGEFEANPSKGTEVYVQNGALDTNYTAMTEFDAGKRLSDASSAFSDLRTVWDGTIENDFARGIVTKTAAIALRACDPDLTADAASAWALKLWRERVMRS